jgi:hypothetical protein
MFEASGMPARADDPGNARRLPTFVLVGMRTAARGHVRRQPVALPAPLCSRDHGAGVFAVGMDDTARFLQH